MSAGFTPSPRMAFITSFIRDAFCCRAPCAVGAWVWTPSATTASSGVVRIVAEPVTVTVLPEPPVPGEGDEDWASEGSVMATTSPSTKPAAAHDILAFIERPPSWSALGRPGSRPSSHRRLPAGPVAQRSEQGAFNPRAAGSNPARPTGRLRSSEGLFTLRGRQTNHRGPALAPHWPSIGHEPSRSADRDGEWHLSRGASPLRASQEVPGRCFATDALRAGGVGRIGSRTLASSRGGALPGGSTHNPP